MNAAFTREALAAALFARRRKKPRSARSRPRKPTRWLYPQSVERRYAAAIRAWLRPMKEFIHEYLKNNQEAMLRGDAAALVRQDAVPGGSYRRMVQSLNGWHTAYIPPLDDDGNRASPPVIFAGLGGIAEEVNDFNDKQWDKSANAALGVEFPVYEDWWPTVKEDWTRTNYELMRGLGQDYIKQVNTLAERAVISGWSPAQLANEIILADRRVSKVRAELIAVDQIGTLNGMVTQARMEGAGLTMYLWSTSGDGRVRHAHALMDGALCRWDDSSVYSDDGGKTWRPRPSGAIRLHPGIDLRCRCRALSYWDELVDEVDAKIAEIEKLEEMAKPVHPAPAGRPSAPVPPALPVQAAAAAGAAVLPLKPKAPRKSKATKPDYQTVDKATKEVFQDISNTIYMNASEQEQKALKAYTGTEFSDMNDMLYGKIPYDAYYDRQNKRLDRIIKKFKLKKDIITYRGTDASHYTDWEMDKTYTLPAFISTSIDKNNEIVNPDFIIEMRIKKGTRGMYIGSLSKHEEEDEFLLGRGLNYRVIEKTKNNMVLEVSND